MFDITPHNARTNYYVVKKINLDFGKPCHIFASSIDSQSAITSQSHHIMNTMNNPKLQAMLDLFTSFGADAVYNCGVYDELTCDEQMKLEQLIED